MTPRPEIRGLSFTDILGVTTGLVRTHLRALVALAAIFLVPAYLIGAPAELRLSDLAAALPNQDQLDHATSAQMDALVQTILLYLGVWALDLVAGTLASVAICRLIADRYAGRASSVGGAVGWAIRRAPTALGTVLLDTLGVAGIGLGGATLATFLFVALGSSGSSGGIGAFLALVVGVAFVGLLITVAIRWTLAMVAVALEPVGPLHALVRSWRLTDRVGWRLISIILVTQFFEGLVGLVAGSIVLAITGVATSGPTPTSVLLLGLLASGSASVLVAPITPVALTVLYVDVRRTREGYEPTGPLAEPVDEPDTTT